MSRVATTKSIDADLVGDLMMQAVEQQFGVNSRTVVELEWRAGNGSCYTASKTRSFARELALKPVTAWIRSPQSNGMGESFVRIFKRDYADLVRRPYVQYPNRYRLGRFAVDVGW